MIDIDSLPFSSVVFTKKKSKKMKPEAMAHFVGLDSSPRPIKSIRMGFVRGRASKYAWLHPAIFGGQTLESVFERSVSTPTITEGYYFMTLTFDRNKSRYVKDGRLLFDKFWKAREAALYAKAGAMSKKHGRKVAVPPHIWQGDIHEDGFPHFHVLFVANNEDTAELLRLFVRWWTDNHGTVDWQPIADADGVKKVIQYILKDRYWHDNPPQHTGMDAVGRIRDLGIVAHSGIIPKIQSVEIKAENPEDDPDGPDGPGGVPEPFVPSAVAFNGVLHPLGSKGQQQASSVRDLVSPHMMMDYISVSRYGWNAVLGRFLHAALEVAGSKLARKVFIERLTSEYTCNAFQTIWRHGGIYRALRNLHKIITSTDSRFAWKLAEIIQDLKMVPVIVVKTSAGTLYEYDMDFGAIYGLRAMSPEVVAARIMLRRIS